MRYLYFLLLPLLFLCCTNPPYRGSEVVGAEEFVMDSYRIREGKFSILQLEGKDYEEMPPAFLDEYEDVIHEGDVFQISIYHPTRTDLIEAVQRVGQTVGFRVSEGKIRL